MFGRIPVVAGTVLAAGALSLTALPAHAAPSAVPVPPSDTGSPPSASDPKINPGMLKAMSRDLGISAADARTRIVNEQRAIAVDKQLRGKLGSDYAGAWVTGKTSKLVVATTDRSRKTAITAAGATAKVVKHSLADLDRAKSALDRAAKKRSPRGAFSWGVDPKTNSVVLRGQSPFSAWMFAVLSGANTDYVRVVRTKERPRTYADLRGGEAYYINGSARCSVGFPVTKGETQGFVSAGHCGKAGDKTTGADRTAQGTFKGSSFPGNDYSWVAVNKKWKATPYVKGPAGLNAPVSGSNEVPVGSSVCRSGSTSHWHCGTIEQRGTSVTYQQGTVYGVTRTDVCAEPGDSGGPFISGRQAQGMTSGGSGDCTSGGTTFFQPVNEALHAYGLKLRTTS